MPSRFSQFVPIVPLLTLLLCTACAVSARDRLSATARHYQMYESESRSYRFKHVLFRNFDLFHGDTLNVYLEGDGQPWFLRLFRSRDPTPRSALMLALMSADTAPALYLGRPCYNEHVRSEHCDPALWTSGRYSTTVVESMAAVLEQEVSRLGVTTLNLFGHSGGGTLALLLAEKIPSVRRVVTLSGNIDTDAWTSHHGYARLYTSLNPASRAALPERVEQIHLLGSADVNIPPSLNRNWVMQQDNSYGVLYPGFDHACCWSSIWPQTLRTLQRGPPYRFSGLVFKTPS